MHDNDVSTNSSTNHKYKNLTTNISAYKKKTTNSVTNKNAVTDISILHQSKLNINIGTLVNHSIKKVVPHTVKLDVEEPNFNPTYSYEKLLVNNSIIQINIEFDNDIFNNTDYYYTNGIFIELISPLAAQSPLATLLIGLRNSQINLYGFSVRQNIYTPTNPDIVEISVGDRPFSAFLTVGQTRQSYNLEKKISIKSSLNFGILGPASMGGFVQSSIHNIEPIGWTNQINNNVVIDYQLKLEKGIISTPHIELNLVAGGNIGTIFNKINGGFYFRTGSFVPVFRGQGSTLGLPATNSKLQYWLFVSGQTNFILYDATLQGGLFSSKSPYIIQNSDINRAVLNLSLGIALYYKKIGLELQNFYLSPEFKNAYDFRWGQIKLIFQL